MVSIQSLMDDRPYHNEPGFEKVRHIPAVRRGSAAEF